MNIPSTLMFATSVLRLPSVSSVQYKEYIYHKQFHCTLYIHKLHCSRYSLSLFCAAKNTRLESSGRHLATRNCSLHHSHGFKVLLLLEFQSNSKSFIIIFSTARTVSEADSRSRAAWCTLQWFALEVNNFDIDVRHFYNILRRRLRILVSAGAT